MSAATIGWGTHSGWMLEVTSSDYPFANWEVPQPAAMRVKTDDGYALVYPETSASQVKTDSGTDLQTVLSNIQSAISTLGGSVYI